jgi:hypothetical protein
VPQYHPQGMREPGGRPPRLGFGGRCHVVSLPVGRRRAAALFEPGWGVRPVLAPESQNHCSWEPPGSIAERLPILWTRRLLYPLNMLLRVLRNCDGRIAVEVLAHTNRAIKPERSQNIRKPVEAAITGIEPDGWQFRSVHLGLSGCVFSPVGIPRWSETPPRSRDVVTWLSLGVSVIAIPTEAEWR